MSRDAGYEPSEEHWETSRRIHLGVIIILTALVRQMGRQTTGHAAELLGLVRDLYFGVSEPF